MIMNSYERCQAAIKMQQVDRIPVELHNFLMCARASGIPFSEFFLNPEQMVHAQIMMQKTYGYDMLLIENGTATLAQALGCTIVYSKNAAPVACTPALKKLSDIRSCKIPEDFGESPLMKAQLATVKRLQSYYKESVFLIGRGDQGPFSLASQVYGMDRFLEALLDEDEEENVHLLLEYCTNVCIRYHKMLLALGVPMTSMGDSTAGPDVISPAMYEEFAMPYEKKVIQSVHSSGGMISLHICGNATKIIEKMISLGADVLEIDQKTDLRLAYEKSIGKCALMGQIDPVTLKLGSEDEIENSLEQILDNIGGRKATGFILGAGCVISPDTPEKNIRLLTGCVYE